MAGLALCLATIERWFGGSAGRYSTAIGVGTPLSIFRGKLHSELGSVILGLLSSDLLFLSPADGIELGLGDGVARQTSWHRAKLSP